MLVDVPEGKDPITYVWGEMVPRIGPAAAKFSAAVYAHSTLSLREFEAARLRIAQVNGCVFCLDYRSERDGVKVADGFDQAVADWARTDALNVRERLCAEYAGRFAEDHHGLDDEFWARMKAQFTDSEIVELTMCLGSWIAFGRLNRVLGLDTACELPAAHLSRVPTT
jgi:alkylhydroperoxidase family enzyme